MISELQPDRSFSLPGGLFAEGGQFLQKAVLRPLSGREEEWLARHPGTPNAVRVSWLLRACLCSLEGHPVNEELIRRMLIADRDYLLLQLRRLTLGDAVWAVVTCPACQQKIDVNFQTSQVPIECRRQHETSYTLRIEHPGRERNVRFRLPTGADQEATLGMNTDAAVNTMLKRCVLDNGGTEFSDEENAALITAMEKHAPDVELNLDLVCPECRHTFNLAFDTSAFFLDEMSVKGDQLLREVHALALYYHWSESEILDLARDRRHAYLDLVNESLRTD